MNSLPFWKASSDLGKKVAPLLDLQLFLIGRDILHPSGNRLLAQGFVRRQSSAGRDRSSVYTSEPVTLWGFGLVFRTPGAALYLPRKPYAPRLLPVEFPLDGIWSKRDMPGLPGPVTPEDEARLLALLGGGFRWLAEYERGAGAVRENLAGRWNSLASEYAIR